LIGIEPRCKETTAVKETIAATTSKEDKGTTITTKEIALKTTSKEMLLPPETHRTPASNAEKKDTTLETAQNVAQTTNTIEQPM